MSNQNQQNPNQRPNQANPSAGNNKSEPQRPGSTPNQKPQGTNDKNPSKF